MIKKEECINSQNNLYRGTDIACYCKLLGPKPVAVFETALKERCPKRGSDIKIQPS